MLKIIKKTLKAIIIILSISIIFVNTVLIIKSETNSKEIPDVFGFTPFIVISGSMEPNISVDDMIIIKKVNIDEIKEGDIISYKSFEDNIIVTHRVTHVVEDNHGEKFFKTKGDNNTIPDVNVVEESQIQGKYICKIPLIGKIVKYVHNPKGMVLIILFIICIYVIYAIIAKEIIRKKYKARINQ